MTPLAPIFRFLPNWKCQSHLRNTLLSTHTHITASKFRNLSQIPLKICGAWKNCGVWLEHSPKILKTCATFWSSDVFVIWLLNTTEYFHFPPLRSVMFAVQSFSNWLLRSVEWVTISHSWIKAYSIFDPPGAGVHFSFDVLPTWADWGSCAHKCES